MMYDDSDEEARRKVSHAEEKEQLKACTLFHGLVSYGAGRYPATGDLKIADNVRNLCARRAPPEEFIAIASAHYDVVPLGTNTETDTPLYGILTQLSEGQMVLFNAFLCFSKEPDAAGGVECVYYNMEGVLQRKLADVDEHLEMAMKMDNLPPWDSEDLGSCYPPAVWFSPRIL